MWRCCWQPADAPFLSHLAAHTNATNSLHRRKLAPEVAAAIPPVLLMHGTADKTVPMEIAVEFVMALKVGLSLALRDS